VHAERQRRALVYCARPGPGRGGGGPFGPAAGPPGGGGGGGRGRPPGVGVRWGPPPPPPRGGGGRGGPGEPPERARRGPAPRGGRGPPALGQLPRLRHGCPRRNAIEPAELVRGEPEERTDPGRQTRQWTPAGGAEMPVEPPLPAKRPEGQLGRERPLPR